MKYMINYLEKNQVYYTHILQSLPVIYNKKLFLVLKPYLDILNFLFFDEQLEVEKKNKLIKDLLFYIDIVCKHKGQNISFFDINVFDAKLLDVVYNFGELKKELELLVKEYIFEEGFPNMNTIERYISNLKENNILLKNSINLNLEVNNLKFWYYGINMLSEKDYKELFNTPIQDQHLEKLINLLFNNNTKIKYKNSFKSYILIKKAKYKNIAPIDKKLFLLLEKILDLYKYKEILDFYSFIRFNFKNSQLLRNEIINIILNDYENKNKSISTDLYLYFFENNKIKIKKILCFVEQKEKINPLSTDINLQTLKILNTKRKKRKSSSDTELTDRKKIRHSKSVDNINPIEKKQKNLPNSSRIEGTQQIKTSSITEKKNVNQYNIKRKKRKSKSSSDTELTDTKKIRHSKSVDNINPIEKKQKNLPNSSRIEETQQRRRNSLSDASTNTTTNNKKKCLQILLIQKRIQY